VEGTLLGFLQTARRAGIRISAAESLDAFRAVETVGLTDRAALKDVLGLVVAKSREEKELFAECFELYFTRTHLGEAQLADAQLGAGDASLARMLLENDRAGLMLALEGAGRRTGAAGIRFRVQANMFVQQIMQDMGLAALTREIERLREHGEDGVGDELERSRDRLRADVREFVERYLALAAPAENIWRDDNLKTVPLWRLERHDVERMRVIVRTLAKKLATRYGRDRRHRRHGHLDVRRTLRRNTAYDGVPFTTAWKKRKIEKPRVVVLCDVSGSVAPVAQLLLLFLHSLANALSDVRSFTFSSHLIDVSDVLDREPVEIAIAEIVKQIGFRSSDYGRSLADFAGAFMEHVDRRTSVIIMGDARSNYSDPRADVMKSLFERAKLVIWLNPESRPSWGTGDSEMLRYAPYCHVARECSNVRALERTMHDLLTRGS
jgi:uncharacterized protein with von Willebrand factor type A (vWA) domain